MPRLDSFVMKKEAEAMRCSSHFDVEAEAAAAADVYACGCFACVALLALHALR